MSASNFRLDPPRLVDDQSSLIAAVKDFMSAKHLAVDTEANSLYAYQEQVCLIQVSTAKADYIIDTLAIPDLSPLAEPFQENGIEKIFHASEYDILIMHDEFQFEFQNLFDTMLAAQILGREKLGLDSLLGEFIGIQVDKKFQRANWGKRPLSAEMLRYAQVDTHYLYQIRNLLAGELKAKKLTPIAEEDFQRACLVYNQVREDKLAPCWRVQGAKNLTPRQAAVLLKLCQYREKTARKQNLPVFKVLSSQSLLLLAEHCPTSVSQLQQLDLPGMKSLRRHAEGLVQAIQEGLQAPPVYPPKRERVDDSFLAREKALKDWRKRTARKMDVNSAVVLPRELLYNLLAANPASRAEVADVLREVPWRLEKFGDEILAVLKRAA